MTVSIAVTNSASTSRPMNVPRMAKTPTTTITSWTQRGDRGHAHPEVGEAERHPAEDADRAEDEQEQRLLGELAADDRADVGLLADLVDRAELVLEREAQRRPAGPRSAGR